MRPLKKESLNEYAKTAAKTLTKRAWIALESKGRNAAWRVIFGAIRYEAQFMREVSPASLVIYQAYVDVAVNFIEVFPRRSRVEAIRIQIADDLKAYRDTILQMKNHHLSPDDHAAGVASLVEIRKAMQLIMVQYQKYQK